MTALGVMGGTFDPIHVGHLAIGEEARETLSLDIVLFVPAGRPPHKREEDVTRIDDRLEMVRLAIADNPAFELSTIEIDRPGLSYTVDTVEALARGEGRGGRGAEREGDDAPRVVVILSAETFSELPTWHEPERLFDAARIAVVPREGYPAPDPAWLARTFGREARVAFLEGPRLGLSSTAIRERVAEGRSIRYLVPTPVEAYIREHDLYRSNPLGAKRGPDRL
jgi:nicotinate-nucleotide adenylyltransferase